jgi:hypothetical protein
MKLNALRNLSVEEDDALTWDFVVSRLMDEAQQIRAGLDELQELGNPDWTACVTLWSLQFQGLHLVAQGESDPTVRARFEAALAERQRVMDATCASQRGRADGCTESEGRTSSNYSLPSIEGPNHAHLTRFAILAEQDERRAREREEEVRGKKVANVEPIPFLQTRINLTIRLALPPRLLM